MSGSEVLSTLLGSEIRGDLLVLFHKNPGLIDTADGVARRIGRATVTVISDLRELLQLGNSDVVFLDRAKDRDLLESVANHLKTVRISGEK